MPKICSLQASSQQKPARYHTHPASIPCKPSKNLPSGVIKHGLLENSRKLVASCSHFAQLHWIDQQLSHFHAHFKWNSK